MTANSSSSKRPNSAPAGNPARSRSAILQQHGVAGRPAQRVVDVAKAVEIDQREDHDAGAAPGQRFGEALDHHAVIWQAGQFVLPGQLAHRLGAAFERTQQRLQAAHGENGAQRERGADRRQQRPHPIHGAKVRAVGHPTEPADDAAARIVQRLQLAAGIWRGLGIEPQVGHAGPPLDQAEPGIVEPPDVAGRPAETRQAPAAAPHAARPGDGSRQAG